MKSNNLRQTKISFNVINYHQYKLRTSKQNLTISSYLLKLDNTSLSRGIVTPNEMLNSRVW